MTKRVLFYAQHLFGIGHVRRAATVARAMAAEGLAVNVVLGGIEDRGADFAGCTRTYLPPVHAADASFRVLLDEDGTPIDDAFRDGRMARLLAEFEAFQPDVVLVELFPFGRRKFRFELLPLLDAARAAERRPRIASSVRDVLVIKSKRVPEMVDTALSRFDAVLVHGDPSLIPFEATFPAMDAVRHLVRYTGYVVESHDIPDWAEAGRGEVIVSVGGGRTGAPLLRAALEARAMTRAADKVWRLLCGPNLPADVLAEITAAAPPGITVEGMRSDFAILLRNCDLSISQGGYNTTMDVLSANTRAVIVPFEEWEESEQTFRARLLARRNLIRLVEAADLTPQTLANAVDQALTEPPPSDSGIDFSGAATTARLVAALAAGDAP